MKYFTYSFLVGKNLTFLRKYEKREIKKGEKMINKIKALPEKVAFGIGITLIFLSGFLLSYENWTAMIVRGIVFFVAIIFILSASYKRHSSIDKKK